ncbi:MAG TPA: hypothetical protein PK006_04075 [Saprospiraceae bacterium]|nr:hypothetical protein [Saprospiraceae bacterium]
MQQIQLNIISFTPVASKGTFSFNGEKQRGFTSIKWDKLFEQFPEGREAILQFYYTNFQAPTEGAINKEVEFAKVINFTNHSFTNLAG